MWKKKIRQHLQQQLMYTMIRIKERALYTSGLLQRQLRIPSATYFDGSTRFIDILNLYRAHTFFLDAKKN